MHNPITQQQAEQLLEDTTPGEWESNPLSGNVASFGHGEIAGTLSGTADRELIMSAPELARTVIWLWEQNQQLQANLSGLHATPAAH